MTSTRCPVCAARLRPGDAWCGQCHTDLRQLPAAPVAVPGPAGGPDATDADGATRPGGAASRRSGRRAAGPPAAGALDQEAAEALAREWAERLASSEAGAGLPAFAARTSGRGGRVVLAVAGCLGIGAVLLLLMAGIGALL